MKGICKGREVADSDAGVQERVTRAWCGAAVASGQDQDGHIPYAHVPCSSDPSPIAVFEIPSKIRNRALRFSHLPLCHRRPDRVSRDGWMDGAFVSGVDAHVSIKEGGRYRMYCVSPLRHLRPKASTTCSSPKASRPRKAPKHPLVVHEGNPKRLQCVRTPPISVTSTTDSKTTLSKVSIHVM
jgi:hypothetical protein